MFDILNPTEEMVDILDIAHAGSQLCRFTGHTMFHYSIAQHELLGSFVVPPENALEFLLHDAAESYVNDMSRPLKHLTACGDAYRPIEEKIQVVIRKKFGLPIVQSPIIHTVDNMMLWAEKQQLMRKTAWPTEEAEKCHTRFDGFFGTPPPVIYELSPQYVKIKFLERFDELRRKDANHEYQFQNSYMR
jgi:5'-deoxynucleotidase YfbR-like HD superfamily hydrolase